MRARSAKTKGKTFQNTVRDLLLESFPGLEPDDIISNPMGNPGEDLMLSPAARKLLPYQFECKHKKSIAAVRFMEQAEAHGKHIPVAVFKENRSKIYALVEFEHFMNLVKGG